MNRMFKQQNRSANHGDNENTNEQPSNVEKPHETEVSTGKFF